MVGPNGFRYALWQASAPNGSGSSVYFKTADGANHLLLLVEAIATNGTHTPASTFNTRYPGQQIYDVDYRGFGPYSNVVGKLVYVTTDGTYIRVESTTSTQDLDCISPTVPE